MSKSEETRQRDECLTEAYGDDDFEAGGACAADAFAGVGSDEWAPRAAERMAGHRTARSTIAETNELAKRVRQLERELLKKQSRGRKSTRSDRWKKKHQSESSDSSVDSVSRSASRSSSSSSSDSASRSPAKGRERKPKYDRRRQTKKGDSLKNSTSLIVYLVKLLQSSYKKGKRVKGLISHLLVVSEKVESGYYKTDSLVGYDDECQDLASKKGMRAFGEIRPAAVLCFLSYDSTTGAKRQQGQQGQAKKQETKGYCFKYNASCCSNSNCQFRHSCMFCGEGSHGSQGCKKETEELNLPTAPA